MIRVLTVEELRKVRQASAEWARENLSSEEARKIMIENGCSELTVTSKEGIKKMNKINYDNSPAAKEKCWQMCLDWFHEFEAYSGEQICQCDGTVIDAPDFMAKLADTVFKFDTKDEY